MSRLALTSTKASSQPRSSDRWHTRLASWRRSISPISGNGVVLSWPVSRSPVFLSTAAIAANNSRSHAGARSRLRCPSVASATSVPHHSSSWTTLASPWSAVASPVGRYGVLANTLVSSFLAFWNASLSAVAGVPRTEASRRAASSRADPAAAARSRSPGDGGEGRRTAPAPHPETSHPPRRDDRAQPRARQPVRNHAHGARRGHRQQVAEQRAVDPGGRFGPGNAGEEDSERDR